MAKKIYLIVDNLRVHHAKLVKEWEEENSKYIKLFYLPAYSPEFNPDEYMLSLQQNPQKVVNFFQHPKGAICSR